jgi:hypothetical protein
VLLRELGILLEIAFCDGECFEKGGGHCFEGVGLF